MPITIECPQCHKRLNAPDNMAGKQAKCPNCKTVMVIPEPVFEADDLLAPLEPTPQPATPAAPPAAFASSGPLFDEEDLSYQVAEPTPSTTSNEPPRRPCPACGEMIVAS